MKAFHLGSGIAAALALCACTYPVVSGTGESVAAVPVAGAVGAELYGEGTTVRVEIPGDVNTLTFRDNGVVEARVHSTNVVTHGTWNLTGGRLCITWTGSTRVECWPYTAALRPGETVTLTSDRGTTARITLIRGTG